MTIPQRTVVLGTLGFGTIVDEETSFRILDRFVEEAVPSSTPRTTTRSGSTAPPVTRARP